MRGVAFEVAAFQPSLDSNKLKECSIGLNNSNEPISVLDTRWSPIPSTSSSSVGGDSNVCTATTPPMIGVSDKESQQKCQNPVSGMTSYVPNEWPELQPIQVEFELQPQRFGVKLDDWEQLLSESAASLALNQSLRLISGDFDDTSLGLQQLLQISEIDHNALAVPDLGLQKASILSQGFQKVSILNQGSQKVEILNQDHDLLLNKPSMVAGIKQEPTQPPPMPPHHQYQLICDQLYAAAELMVSGNCSHAQVILARLNHQLVLASPPNKPFQRAAFCFKEAMQMQIQMELNPNKITPPLNGMFNMGAYKMFSEVSPVIQFMNFTSNQTLLEAVGDSKNIHIIDFDIGFGAQWASFIQELPTRNNNGGDCEGGSLKITAFASPLTHHPLELALMHENLSQIAQEMGISFNLEVVNFDSFDPRWFSVAENETVAVNFPIWSAFSNLSAIPSILHFVKQLKPRIVVSLDRGCERTDLPFPRYLLQALGYYEVLLDSIDGADLVSDVSNIIERYLLQSQIERMVMGKLQFPEPTPHWESLFTAAGYSRVSFSKFAETQAECVLKRMHVRGFLIQNRRMSLVLCWQDRELMRASAWKC
ncbi:hypothetical protein R6Q57_016782 [Mikania cordata]